MRWLDRATRQSALNGSTQRRRAGRSPARLCLRRDAAPPHRTGGARSLFFSPTRPPRKDRHNRGYKEAEMGGRRGCARDGGDATFIRYSDTTTCLRVDGSDAVGARSLSNLQGPQDDEGEERGEGCWRRSQFNPVQVSARWLSEPALPGPWAPVGLGKNYSAALSFKGAARRLGGLSRSGTAVHSASSIPLCSTSFSRVSPRVLGDHFDYYITPADLHHDIDSKN